MGTRARDNHHPSEAGEGQKIARDVPTIPAPGILKFPRVPLDDEIDRREARFERELEKLRRA